MTGRLAQQRYDYRNWNVTGYPASLAAGGLFLALAAISVAAILILGTSFAERFNIVGFSTLALSLLLMALVLRDPAAALRNWPLLGAIALFSFALRFWSAALTDGIALGSDPMNYTNLATALLEGRGLITDDWFYGPDLRAYFPPLYPILLAGFWKLFGISAFSTLAMQTLIDAIAAWALADTGRRMGQKGAGYAAALAYFAWPAFAFAAGIPQKESLTLLLVMLLLRGLVAWLADSTQGARRWRHGLWLGLWWGMVSLTQPSLALLPAIIALILAWQVGFTPVMRLGLSALPTLLAVLAPWWLRNGMLFGTFIPFTTASGMMLNSAWRELQVPFPADIFDLSEPERSALMGKLAREAIVQNPTAFFSQSVKSHAIGFAYEEASLARFRSATPPISALNHARIEALLQGSYAAMLLSAMAGAWRQFRASRTDMITFYAFIVLLSIGAINIWFEFGERHRLILTPFLLLVAASFWLGLRGDREMAKPGDTRPSHDHA